MTLSLTQIRAKYGSFNLLPPVQPKGYEATLMADDNGPFTSQETANNFGAMIQVYLSAIREADDMAKSTLHADLRLLRRVHTFWTNKARLEQREAEAKARYEERVTSIARAHGLTREAAAKRLAKVGPGPQPRVGKTAARRTREAEKRAQARLTQK